MPTEAEALQALKDKLRRQLGNLTTTQFTDEQCEDAVNSAIKEYSKYRPINVLDYLTTGAGQAIYDLSTKERIIRVKEVFYSTGNEYMPEEFWPETAQLGRLEGISIFDNPSIWLQYMQRLEQYKAIFNGDFEYERATKALRLIPPPTIAGKKVYYVWSQRHTPLTIPEDDVDILLLWAKGEAKEMLAGKKGQEIQSVSGYGESVTFGASSESLMTEAEDFKARFQRKFGGSVLLAG